MTGEYPEGSLENDTKEEKIETLEPENTSAIHTVNKCAWNELRGI